MRHFKKRKEEYNEKMILTYLRRGKNEKQDMHWLTQG
jgi:hypothetical protein